MKLCNRFSGSRSSNPRSDFWSDLSLVEKWANQKRVFYSSGFQPIWWNFAIGFQGTGVRIRDRILYLTFHWSRNGQSETSFLFIGFSSNLMELCNRFSGSRGPNPGLDFWSDLSLVEKWPIRNELFYSSGFRSIWWNFAISFRRRRIRIRSRTFDLTVYCFGNRPTRNELFLLLTWYVEK